MNTRRHFYRPGSKMSVSCWLPVAAYRHASHGQLSLLCSLVSRRLHHNTAHRVERLSIMILFIVLALRGLDSRSFASASAVLISLLHHAPAGIYTPQRILPTLYATERSDARSLRKARMYRLLIRARNLVYYFSIYRWHERCWILKICRATRLHVIASFGHRATPATKMFSFWWPIDSSYWKIEGQRWWGDYIFFIMIWRECILSPLSSKLFTMASSFRTSASTMGQQAGSTVPARVNNSLVRYTPLPGTNLKYVMMSWDDIDKLAFAADILLVYYRHDIICRSLAFPAITTMDLSPACSLRKRPLYWLMMNFGHFQEMIIDEIVTSSANDIGFRHAL